MEIQIYIYNSEYINSSCEYIDGEYDVCLFLSIYLDL